MNKDKLERFKAFAMKHYDNWGSWEIECNEDQDWCDVLETYSNTQAGLDQWAQDCEEDLEIRKENNGFYEVF
jgi:hypothetical protein